MAHLIARFTSKKTGRDYYLIWSTIVDAPITFGMSLQAFKGYYARQYGQMEDLKGRLQRVKSKGTSAIGYKNIKHLIRMNRAGEKEKHLTYDQIVSKYCEEKNAT